MADEPHIDGWPLLSGLPPAAGAPVERPVRPLPEPPAFYRYQFQYWNGCPPLASEGLYSADQMRAHAEQEVAAERERWKERAVAACNGAGDGPDNGCCPTYWEEAREACIAAIQKA